MKKTLMILLLTLASPAFSQMQGGSDIGSHSVEVTIAPDTDFLIVKGLTGRSGCSRKPLEISIDQNDNGQEYTVSFEDVGTIVEARSQNETVLFLQAAQNQLEKKMGKKLPMDLVANYKKSTSDIGMSICAGYFETEDHKIIPVSKDQVGQKLIFTGGYRVSVEVIQVKKVQ